jgi:hypothetical protein
MRSVLVLALFLICAISCAQKPLKINVQYISQDEAKKLDAINDPDFGLVLYKEKALRKFFNTSSEVDTFLNAADFTALQKKAVSVDIIYIISITGQEPGYSLSWDENSQQYIH